MISGLAFNDARCSAVLFDESLAFISAPFSISSRTISKSPEKVKNINQNVMFEIQKMLKLYRIIKIALKNLPPKTPRWRGVCSFESLVITSAPELARDSIISLLPVLWFHWKIHSFYSKGRTWRWNNGLIWIFLQFSDGKCVPAFTATNIGYEPSSYLKFTLTPSAMSWATSSVWSEKSWWTILYLYYSTNLVNSHLLRFSFGLLDSIKARKWISLLSLDEKYRND